MTHVTLTRSKSTINRTSIKFKIGLPVYQKLYQIIIFFFLHGKDILWSRVRLQCEFFLAVV